MQAVGTGQNKDNHEIDIFFSGKKFSSESFDMSQNSEACFAFQDWFQGRNQMKIRGKDFCIFGVEP